MSRENLAAGLIQSQSDQTGEHPHVLSQHVRPTRCDYKNPCPDRPRWRLWQFTDRPWRCAQCGRWWVTFRTSSYPEPEGFWVWVRAEDDAK